MVNQLNVILAALLCLILTGCARYPINPPLETFDPNVGYRFNNLESPENSDSLFVIVTFSGGGTRAAALSYGVLDELRNTKIRWDGSDRRLIDEIDVISSVSGGSFTSAYYGLFRDEIFESFDEDFLYRDIEGELKSELRNPANWFRLASKTFGRIDMASKFYDREIFREKTFGDLLRLNQRPFIMLNATDMSIGARFTFVQQQFDWLCSDLQGVKVARAVAASSNFPVAFTPLTVNNYAGQCGFSEPGWIQPASKDLQINPRRFRRAQLTSTYGDSQERPYIHLLDGGIADNIGLRGPLVALLSNDVPWSLVNKINLGAVEKLVVIIVDAKTAPGNNFDKSASPPGTFDVLKTIATVPMDNFSFDTLQILRDAFKRWNTDRRSYASCDAILLSRCPNGEMPYAPPPPVDLYPIYIGFDQIGDPQKRRYFQTMATSFALPAQQVDDLKQIGMTLLRESSEFKRLREDLVPSTNGQ